MNVVDGRHAVSWAAFVLVFAVYLASLWTPAATKENSRQRTVVVVRPYRLSLVRRDNQTGSTKPEVRDRRYVRSRQKQSIPKVAAVAAPLVAKRETIKIHKGGKPLPVVAFLTSVAKKSKSRTPGATRRTVDVPKKTSTNRKTTRHKKRGAKETGLRKSVATSVVIRRSASQPVPRKKHAELRQADDYYQTPYSDADDDQHSDEYSDKYLEPTYADDHYQDLDQPDDGYTGPDNDDYYPESTYDDVPHDESYPAPAVYQDPYVDDYNHGPEQEQSYDAPEAAGYQEEDHENDHGDDSYAEPSYQEPNGYEESNADEYGHETNYEKPYTGSDTYPDGQDSGYDAVSNPASSYPVHPSRSDGDGYDTGADEYYQAESHPQGSYPKPSSDLEYDGSSSYPEAYQPSYEEPSYQQPSYQPDYQPSYTPSRVSYPKYDQYPQLDHQGSYEEPEYKPAAYPEPTYPESSYDSDSYSEVSYSDYAVDNSCPYPPDEFCYGKEPGHYGHPGSEYCFIQCDHVEQAFAKHCAYGTMWKGKGSEAAYANMCA